MDIDKVPTRLCRARFASLIMAGIFYSKIPLHLGPTVHTYTVPSGRDCHIVYWLDY